MLKQQMIEENKIKGGHIIDCSKVSMRFGKIMALDEVDLRVEYGENYGLLGPNGAGKTTLIRILCGLLKPTSGTAIVLGRKMPDRRNNASIGYMTQMDALYNDLTIRENVRFFASIYGLRGHERERRIDEILEVTALSDRQHSVVSTISGGMRKRASIACALVHRPRLLFLDEPTVGVDPKLRCDLWKYFHELNSEGVTLVVSTHVMDEAEHCNRLAFIREGKKLIEGTPAELKAFTSCENLESAFMKFSEAER
ncbi:ABC-type multidrug transport system, ATPase component [Methanocella conradii HZ254]|uniref:ABC-type multidrug transport system, ATPase component n=1 Tax=Methanocella conradii (strain DSM 24694 / JCM 17849 / CGMCC 1.5162 / HZ254) TaxID=1041930 RepID=H8I912_METCZ|nr:ABC transporter ATP-binding protein [Methanocella conradii]AFC99015.1 ABC-type multidrug transport system, ATPase component [Methanocella conradii HZ254]